MRVGKTLTSRGWLFNKLTIKQHSSDKHLRRCTFDDEEDEFFVCALNGKVVLAG